MISIINFIHISCETTTRKISLKFQHLLARVKNVLNMQNFFNLNTKALQIMLASSFEQGTGVVAWENEAITWTKKLPQIKNTSRRTHCCQKRIGPRVDQPLNCTLSRHVYNGPAGSTLKRVPENHRGTWLNIVAHLQPITMLHEPLSPLTLLWPTNNTCQ